MSEAFNNQYRIFFIRAWILHFIIVLVIVHYLLNSYNYNKQIFSSYQLSSPKVVQLFNFSPQLFKTYFPIFQVSKADFCPESCKRSQIYAGSIPAFPWEHRVILNAPLWTLACIVKRISHMGKQLEEVDAHYKLQGLFLKLSPF